jgi:hypothetical protein
MSTGNPANSKRVTLKRYGPATITKVAGGFRVAADSGATADFQVDRGDIVVTSCDRCNHGYMQADLSAAWSAKNRPVPPDAPMSVTIPLSRAGQRAFDEGMSAEQDGMNRRLLGRMGFRTAVRA